MKSALNDARVEAAVKRLHTAANQQFSSLLLHYLPKLPGLLLGKGIP